MKPVREYDASGKLVAAGYEWGELDGFRVILFLAVAALALGLALFALDLVTKSLASLPLFILASAAAWAAHELHKRRHRTRSLIFRDDGAIEAPHRLPDFSWPRYRVEGHHEDILNISKLVDHEPGGKTSHRAAIYAANGNIVRVTGEVHPDIAHKVAAQLTAALQEIRAATSWSANAPVAGG